MVDQTDIIFDEVRFMESFFRTLAIAMILATSVITRKFIEYV